MSDTTKFYPILLGMCTNNQCNEIQSVNLIIKEGVCQSCQMRIENVQLFLDIKDSYHLRTALEFIRDILHIITEENLKRSEIISQLFNIRAELERTLSQAETEEEEIDEETFFNEPIVIGEDLPFSVIESPISDSPSQDVEPPESNQEA